MTDATTSAPSGAGTANARFKADHGRRLHWSVFASVLLHFAVFLGWPEMQPPRSGEGGVDGAGYLEVLTLAIDEGSAPSGAAPRLVETSSGGEEAVPDDDRSETDADPSAPVGWEHLPSNLWRLAALRPQLADSARAAEERNGRADEGAAAPSAGSTDADSLRIRLEAAELDLQRLSEEERLSLERLSAYRPQLVLSSPSSWLVVRNPDEVGAFMDARLGRSGPDARGIIGIAIWVDELGSVEWADIVQSSGDPTIDDAAIEMFRKVVSFRPAREDGSRVSVAAMYWVLW